MTYKRAVLRARADQDVQEAIDFYLGEGAQRAALRFIDALEQGLRDIERHPGIGSTRYAHELDIPGLRCWPLKGYPHLVFYLEREDYVDVWRVLHGSRDIPVWLQASDRRMRARSRRGSVRPRGQPYLGKAIPLHRPAGRRSSRRMSTLDRMSTKSGQTIQVDKYPAASRRTYAKPAFIMDPKARP